MEINHCYSGGSDSGLSSSNHGKHPGSPYAALCKMSRGELGWGGGWEWVLMRGRGGERQRGVRGHWREMVISTSHQWAGVLHKDPRAVSKFCWQKNAIKQKREGWRSDWSLVHPPSPHPPSPHPPLTLRAHSLTPGHGGVRLWCLLLSVWDQYFKRPIKEEIELGIDWSAVKKYKAQLSKST